MKAIKHDLSKFDDIILIPLSDIHLGDRHCSINEVLTMIEFIKQTDNAFCILNGDVMNCAIKTAVSDIYSEGLTPMEELKECVNLFAPIKDKILGVTGGNHEGRHYKTNGIDLTAIMCQQLGISDLYCETGIVLFLRVGENSDSKYHKRPILYTVYATHGSGGGKKEGGKINRVADLAGIIDADVYIHSHTHMPAIFKECFYRTDTANSSISLVEKTFINTNAFLTYGGYGELGGFKPASKSVPQIMLDGSIKKVTAFM